MISDTPRTDAAILFATAVGVYTKDEGMEEPPHDIVVQADFARELERENNALKAKANELEQDKARLSGMADKLLAHMDDGTHEDGGECSACSVICCPDEDPLHFHHDGCPSCSKERT